MHDVWAKQSTLTEWENVCVFSLRRHVEVYFNLWQFVYSACGNAFNKVTHSTCGANKACECVWSTDSYLKITDARHRVPDSQTLAVKLARVGVAQKKISVLLLKPCHETNTNIGYRLQTDITQNMIHTKNSSEVKKIFCLINIEILIIIVSISNKWSSFEFSIHQRIYIYIYIHTHITMIIMISKGSCHTEDWTNGCRKFAIRNK